MARKSKNKSPKFKVAIVGEGYTEWYYFTNMKQYERFTFKVEPELPKHSNYKTTLASETFQKIKKSALHSTKYVAKKEINRKISLSQKPILFA